MATTTSLQCEIALAKDGDLVRVTGLTPLKPTFGVPDREAVETVSGVLLYADQDSLSGKAKYALLTNNKKTVVAIGDVVDNVKKGVMATADGASGEAAHNGEGSWFVFHH